MHFNTKKAYTNLFPQINLDQKELSLSDLRLIANHFFRNINFDSEKINDFLMSLDRCFRPTQYYKKSLALFLNPSNTPGGSEMVVDYWVSRGWSEEQAKEKISKIQRERSILCLEFWKARGFSDEDATMRISEIQKYNANKSNAVYDIEYWLNRGYSLDAAINEIGEAKNQRSAWTIGFWARRGFTEEESRDIVKKNSRNATLENLIEKHGIELGSKMKIDIEKRKYKFPVGKDNPQFGKPANKGSGASVSGTYKNYYFRSLLEYFTIKHLEKNDIPFVCNDVSKECFANKVVIPYKDAEGKNRNYIPDFIVNNTEVWEVKNAYSLTTEDVRLKLDYARDFINNSNTLKSLSIVTENDIETTIDDVLNDVIKGDVVIDRGKIKRFYKRIGKVNESYIKEKIGHLAKSL